MKIWMADVKDDDSGDRETAILFAEHETAARAMINNRHEDKTIEDMFEIKGDDPRWDNLYILGKLVSPERF